MMRTILLCLLTILTTLPAWACEACARNQPKVLKGISHGTGPQSQWDMPIIVISAVVVVITLVFAVKYLVWPREKAADHIKRTVLQTPIPDHGR